LKIKIKCQDATQHNFLTKTKRETTKHSLFDSYFLSENDLNGMPIWSMIKTTKENKKRSGNPR
jgi:hypothetical protein